PGIPVTTNLLAELLKEYSPEDLEKQILSSFGFMGNDGSRKSWAKYLRENNGDLLMGNALKQREVKEKEKQRVSEAKENQRIAHERERQRIIHAQQTSLAKFLEDTP